MMMLTLYVAGQPRQKGSMNAFVVPRKGVKAALAQGAPVTSKDFKPVTTSSNPNAKYYEKEIRDEAAKYMTGPLWTGPIIVEAFFVMPRPQRLKTRFEPCLTTPDTDKMLRCVLDALTHVVYADDKQVVHARPFKRYANLGEPPHTSLRVHQATTEDLLKLEDAERQLGLAWSPTVAPQAGLF